ncbi:polyketide synthase, partial [Cryptosporidium ryanae]|uniref:polyketide synthase n=1 Tax=Cryptosporidium ryanae TaxID=515981 RepID=UPI00351A168E
LSVETNEIIANIKIYSEKNNDLLVEIKKIRYRGVKNISTGIKLSDSQFIHNKIEKYWSLNWVECKDENNNNAIQNSWLISLNNSIFNRKILIDGLLLFENKNELFSFINSSKRDNINIAFVIDKVSNIENSHLNGFEIIELLKLLNDINLNMTSGTKILFITVNTISFVNGNTKFMGSDVWGLIRSARYELFSMNLCLLDLESSIMELEDTILLDILLSISNSDNSEFILRNNKLLVPRICDLNIPQNGPYRMVLSERGAISNLSLGIQDELTYINSDKNFKVLDCLEKFNYFSSKNLIGEEVIGENEILLRVCAVGLNFRDVLNVLDLYPGEPGPPCSDCSGIVLGVGKGIKHLKVGDQVYAMVPGCLNTFIVTTGDTCRPIPKNCDFSLASSIPTIFSTVDLTLRKICNIKSGDRILIHAASGGVGIVAVNYCLSIGAIVYATVGNKNKEEYLRHLGVRFITTSRNPEIFKNKMDEILKNEKLNVIINCLSGNYIKYSIELLSDGGFFIELGKINILSKEDVLKINPKVNYETIALDDMILNDPSWFGTVLDEIKIRIENCQESLIPLKEFSMINENDGINLAKSDCTSAFRYMQKASHIGKVIIKNPTINRKLSYKDGTVILTGGNGDLGKFTATWLLSNGFKNIVVLSRNSNKGNICAFPKVRFVECDISSLSSVLNAFEMILSDNSHKNPIVGVIHAAGLVDDKKIFEQTRNSFEYVYRPKVNGILNIHYVTQLLGINLELFVAFSSVSGLIGNIGQANYSAANSFMDSFMGYRLNLGLCGTSLQWGPWFGQGMAKNNLISKFESIGIRGVDKFTAIQTINYIFNSINSLNNPAICVNYVDWFKLSENLPKSISNILIDVSKKSADKIENKSGFVKVMKEMNSKEKEEYILNLIKDIIDNIMTEFVIDINEENILERPLFELGIDSLSAIEFRNILSKTTGILLPTTLMFDYPTISGVKNYIISQIDEVYNEEILKNNFNANKISNNFEIAIIGISCKLPGSSEDPESFWKMLVAGSNCVSNIPLNRWDHKKYYCGDPDDSGPNYCVNHGSFIDNVELFDSHYFGISPLEASIIDPQQRLSLMLSIESIKDAQISASNLKGTLTGVFVGCGNTDWALMQGSKIIESDFVSPLTGTSVALSIISNRISYNLGLNGPSMTIDTACSSSLVAIDLAIQSLRGKKCDIAIIIGVNLLLSQQAYIAFSKSKMLSITGSCKTFDKDADGYVRGEGCCSMVLCRIDKKGNKDVDEKLFNGKNKQNIYSVLKGSSVNQDGRSASLTAPNGPAQEKVISSAIFDSSLTFEDISIIEAHGTGTSLGDPIEFGAIKNVFNQKKRKSLFITAVKTNIGHLEGASGIAGVIKMILMLNKSIIPKNINFKILNPLIDISNFNFILPNKNYTGSYNYGGVSSFGFGGTNAHVIVGRYISDEVEIKSENKLVFMYTGQGSQFENMGKELFENEIVFRNAMLKCAECIDEYLPESLIGVLYPDVVTPKTKAGSIETGFYDINDIQYSQISIFSLEYSLTKLLESKGIIPDVVIGHSLGEYCAAVVVGALELDQALKLISARAKYMLNSGIKEGGMLALRVSSSEINKTLKNYGDSVSLAAVNGPKSVVISGTKPNLCSVLKTFNGNGKFLNVENAFHSKLMIEVSEKVDLFIKEEIVFSEKETNIEFFSTLRGCKINTSDLRNSKYWSEHIVQPVLFYDTITSLLNQCDNKTFIEIGPQPTLTKLCMQYVPRESRENIRFLNTLIASKIESEIDNIDKLIKTINNEISKIQYESDMYNKTLNFQKIRRYPWNNISFHPFLELDGENVHLNINGMEIKKICKEGLILEFINAGIRKILNRDLFNSIKYGKYTDCEIIIKSMNLFKLENILSMKLTIKSKNETEIITELDLNSINKYRYNVILNYNEELFPNGNKKIKITSYKKIEDYFSSKFECVSAKKYLNTINTISSELDINIFVLEEKNCFRYLIFSKDKLKSISKSYSGFYIHPMLIQIILEFIKIENIIKNKFEEFELILENLTLCEIIDSSIYQEYLFIDINSGSANVQNMLGKKIFSTEYSISKISGPTNNIINNLPGEESSFKTIESIIWKNTLREVLEIKLSPEFDLKEISDEDKAILMSFSKFNVNMMKFYSKFFLITGVSDLLKVFEDDYKKLILVIDNFCGDEIQLIHYITILFINSTKDQEIWIIKTKNYRSCDIKENVAGGGILGLCKTARIELKKNIYYIQINNPEQLDFSEVILKTVPNIINNKQSLISKDLVVSTSELKMKLFTSVIEPYSIYKKENINNLNIKNGKLNGVVIITGGTGALGLLTTQWLIKTRGIKDIVLLSRSGKCSSLLEVLWDDINKLNANVNVIKCDISNLASVEKTIIDIISNSSYNCKKIIGVIHAAGIINDILIKNHTIDILEQVFKPKVHGAINLHLAIENILPYKLMFYIGFSSISSLFGSFGQYNYSSANSYLDSIIKFRKENGVSTHLDLSIQWGPWAEQGMAKELAQHHSTMGIEPLLNSECLQFLSLILDLVEKDMCNNIPSEIAVSKMNWKSFISNFEDEIPYLFSELFNSDIKDENERNITKLITEKFKNVTDIKKYIEEALKRIGYEVFGLTENQDLSEIDSMMAIEFRNSIYKDLGVKLPTTLMLDNPTIEEVIDYIEGIVRKELFGEKIKEISTSKQRRWNEIRDDILLGKEISIGDSKDLSVVHGIRLPYGNNGTLRNVFLTGGTGFMGTCVIENLVKANNEIKIWCLVRCENVSSGKERLRSCMEKYIIDKIESILENNIVVVEGDTSLPMMGIDESKYNEMASLIDCIINVGAIVNFTSTYSHIRRVNVLSILELLKLSSTPTSCNGNCTEKGIFYDHIENQPVGPYLNGLENTKFIERKYFLEDGRRIFYEDDPVIYNDLEGDHHKTLMLGYSQSKWAAERLVRNARKKGFPIAIYRPGRIGGNSKTGASNISDLPNAFIKGCILMGCLPITEMAIHLVPVDFCSQVCCFGAANPILSINNDFNLDSKEWASIYDIKEALGLIGIDIKLIPFEKWIERLTQETSSNKDHPLGPLQHMFVKEKPADSIMPYFDMSNTNKLIGQSNYINHISCDVNYLKTCFNFFLVNDWSKTLEVFSLRNVENSVKDHCFEFPGIQYDIENSANLTDLLVIICDKLLILDLQEFCIAISEKYKCRCVVISIPSLQTENLLNSITYLTSFVVKQHLNSLEDSKEGKVIIGSWSLFSSIAIQVYYKLMNNLIVKDLRVLLIDPLIPVKISEDKGNKISEVLFNTVKEIINESDIIRNSLPSSILKLIKEPNSMIMFYNLINEGSDQVSPEELTEITNAFKRLDAIFRVCIELSTHNLEITDKTFLILSKSSVSGNLFKSNGSFAIVNIQNIYKMENINLMHLSEGNHFKMLKDPYLTKLIEEFSDLFK